MIRLRVYELMARRGYRTRKALAEASGIHQSNLGKIVAGEVSAIRLETIDALCDALECEPGELFERIPEQIRRHRIASRKVAEKCLTDELKQSG